MKNKEITKAILKVMTEVKGIEKSLTVGTGNNSYKGVSDKDVKLIVGKAMAENGLTIMPIDIDPTIKIDRWEAKEYWNQKEVIKQKQAVFTEVKVTYLLMHESGESIEFMGYGHGVDPQDKSAGKAMTYALKYALLYIFLVPTGTIDDADNTHSEEVTTPEKPVEKKATKPKKISLDKKRFDGALEQIKIGKYTFEELKNTFTLTKKQRDIVKDLEEEAELEKVAKEAELKEVKEDTETIDKK
jgi:ERF superfamily